MIDIMENKILGPAILKGEATMPAHQLERRFWGPSRSGLQVRKKLS
jgi:hypothetical protein